MRNNQNILDVLWEYVDTFNPYASDDEKKVLSIVSEKSDAFKKMITDDQYSLFEDYQDSLLELCSVEKKEAFIKGVKFASQLIIEIMRDS